MGWRAQRREGADKRRHFDDDVAIVMRETGQGAEDDDGTTEFFANFPNEGGFRDLVGLDFSAGEFPLQRQMLVRRALRDKDEAGRVRQDGADDGNGWRLGHGMKSGQASQEERFGGLGHQSSVLMALGTQAAG